MNKTNFAVIEYLRNGNSTHPVTHDDIKSYLSDYVLQKPEVPMHYRLRLDELLRKLKHSGDIRPLLSYLSNTLGCTAFVLDENNITLRGLSKLSYHDNFDLLLDFVENDTFLHKFFEENFSLNPLHLSIGLNINDVDILDVVLVATDFYTLKIGLVGSLSLDFDLAVGILKYLQTK